MPGLDFEAVANGKNPERRKETAVVPVKPMDLEAVRTGLKAAYDADIDKLMVIAEAHEVTDDESEKAAIEMVAQAKRLEKALDTKRKGVIEKPDGFVRGINGLCRGFRDRLITIEKGLKPKIGNHQYKKEIERRKREKAAEAAAEKLRKQAAKDAKKAGVEAPPIDIVPVVEKKETVTRTDSGASAHIRMSWKMTTVEDFTKVPDEYKELNMKQINAAIKAGIRNIPGLKIEEVADTVMRF